MVVIVKRKTNKFRFSNNTILLLQIRVKLYQLHILLLQILASAIIVQVNVIILQIYKLN